MMVNYPLVSVVVPVYQAENTIAQTLQSVIDQDYRPIEVIVINDGSTDRSTEKVTELINKQPEGVTFHLYHQTNGGVSKARNEGMKKASGSYIALLDADDIWLPHKLSKQIEVFRQHPQIDFLGTQRNGEYLRRWGLKKFGYLTPISSRLLLYKTFFVTPTVLFKRKVLEKTGYFKESQRYAEEGNYWIRVCLQNQAWLLNESLVITGGGKPHFGYSGLSSNLEKMEEGELKNLHLGYKLGVVGPLEYVVVLFFSIIKYIRRIIVVKLRKG